MFIDVNIPAGVVTNGTDLQAEGRWRDASLVRWSQGSMGPVGGWTARHEDLTEPPRGALAWRDNSGDVWLAIGQANALLAYREGGGDALDITPDDLATGFTVSTLLDGFGIGYFGTGTFGTERSGGGFIQEATRWSLDNFGQYLVGVHSVDGRLFSWELSTTGTAEAVANAPEDNTAVFVTPENFLVLLGAGGDGRKIQWSDQADYTVWSPLSTNQAGDINIQSSGSLMCGAALRGQSLVLTETSAHTMDYIGTPYIYSVQQVGFSCGPISARALVAVGDGAFWMGDGQFYVYSGNAVDVVACDVLDSVFSGIDGDSYSLIHGVANSEFSEVWWFYPSEGSAECDRYVAYNYREGHWMTGELSRTAGVDRGPFRSPVWCSADTIYDHESGFEPSGSMAYAESAPLSFGETLATVTELMPDESSHGQVTATLKARYWPTGAETSYGPYSMDRPVKVLFTARQARVRVSGDTDADWRYGRLRLTANQRGRK